MKGSFLDASAGLAEARWALRSPKGRKMLRRELEALLSDGSSLGRCRLRRAKLKPGRKLSAYFDVSLLDRAGISLGSRPVAVTWEPEGAPAATDRPVDMQAEAIRRGIAAPFGTLHAEVPARGMSILVWPLDTSFPQLVRLGDPRYVAAISGSTHRPPGVRTVRYRPGQRHVLRFDFPRSDRNAIGPLFAKLYRDENDRRRALSASAWGAEQLEQVPQPVAAAAPLMDLPDDGTLVWEGLSGRSLSRVNDRSSASVADPMRLAGVLLRALHRPPQGFVGELPTSDVDEELRLTARACEHITRLVPDVGYRVSALLERARQGFASLPPAEPTFLHGDFKLDHLWATEDRLTVIDFDAACVGDPAFDLGKLLADLRWWRLQGGPAASRPAREAFLDGYGTASVPTRVRRAAIWEAVLLVKMAARRTPVVDTAWEARVARLVSLAEELLGRTTRLIA
jgi:hypothetical protein